MLFDIHTPTLSTTLRPSIEVRIPVNRPNFRFRRLTRITMFSDRMEGSKTMSYSYNG